MKLNWNFRWWRWGWGSTLKNLSKGVIMDFLGNNAILVSIHYVRETWCALYFSGQRWDVTCQAQQTLYRASALWEQSEQEIPVRSLPASRLFQTKTLCWKCEWLGTNYTLFEFFLFLFHRNSSSINSQNSLGRIDHANSFVFRFNLLAQALLENILIWCLLGIQQCFVPWW